MENTRADIIMEAIECHNDTVRELHALGQILLDTYPDVGNTPVNDAFFDLFDSMNETAIFLCCEANALNNGKWATDDQLNIFLIEEENA